MEEGHEKGKNGLTLVPASSVDEPVVDLREREPKPRERERETAIVSGSQTDRGKLRPTHAPNRHAEIVPGTAAQARPSCTSSGHESVSITK